MKKLSFFGIGPKIGRVALPCLVVTIVLTVVFPCIFTFGEAARSGCMIAGAALLVVGLALYFMTVRSLLRGLKETKLITTGSYRYCQSPLYALLLMLVIPAITLLLNSWLVLTTSIVGYILFKRFIGEEYKELTEVFGDEFIHYSKSTPEFCPFGKRG